MEHSIIPDGERHEPKGIQGAPANRVYISNSGDSGTWRLVDANTLLGAINNATPSGRIVTTEGSGGLSSQETLSSDLILYNAETLTAVIQELQNRIESLESRVDALENPE